MNKLVSKNPVLRFKLGLKIEKLLGGGWAGYYTPGNWPKSGNRVNKLSIKEVTIDGGELPGVTVIGKRPNLNTTIEGGQLPEVVVTGQRKTSTASKKAATPKSNNKAASQLKTYRGQTVTLAPSGSNPETKLKQIVRESVAITKPTTIANRAATGYTLPEGITNVTNTQTMLKNAGFDLGKYGVDGVWGKDTQAAYDAWKNKLATNAGGTIGTTSNVTYTPTNTGVKITGNRYNFTLPNNTNTSIYESYYPGTYSNLNNMFTRKGIRSNRGTNYSNVNEYWDWLLNNKDSEDYKVWSNIMGNNGYLNKEIFDNVISKYGIRGNLGRRDSGRLSNLLNDLNLIGVQGRDKDGNIVMSDARRAFLTNFDRNLPSSEEINEYVRTNTPARPNLSTINWGTTTSTISSDNPFNIDKSKYPHLFAKKGGLISRNPIKRFKNLN